MLNAIVWYMQVPTIHSILWLISLIETVNAFASDFLKHGIFFLRRPYILLSQNGYKPQKQV